MEVYETDEQQADAIRKWIKENGKSVITTVLFAASIVLGIKYYQHHKEVVRIEASEHYMALMISQMQEDSQSASAKATKIMDGYSQTPYAALAGLFSAKLLVDDKEYDQALVKLQWVIDNTSVEEFTNVARARAARIHIDHKRYDDALTLLEHDNKSGFIPVLEELRGDIFVATNDIESAKTAYQQALQMLQTKQLEHPLLKLKLQELGGEVLQNDEAKKS